MERDALVARVSEALGDRQLVWFGTRGDDVAAAADVPQLGAVFSIISTYKGRSSVQAESLEDLTGTRPDLDTFEIDDEPATAEGRAALSDLRRSLLRTLARPSAVFTYRPSMFLSSLCFTRRDRARYLGLFKGHQVAFEHKPWVETAIADLGLPHVPWSYVADDDQLETLRLLEDGPVILRRSRTTGGVGLTLLDDRSRLRELWPKEPEAYVSVAPYLGDGIPVNVGAVVWRDGVTVHPASVQLVGIDGCTARPFGFCGNDFDAAGALGPDVLDEIDVAVVVVGRWLQGLGFRGAFGVDFLVTDGVPLFTEVNPRLQGSTHASCRLSIEQGESCLLIEHLAANLNLAAPASRPLRVAHEVSTPLSHLIVHWPGEPGPMDSGALVARVREASPTACIDVVLPAGAIAEPGATVARISVRESLTTDGFSITGPLRDAVDEWLAGLADSAEPEPVPPDLPLS